MRVHKYNVGGEEFYHISDKTVRPGRPTTIRPEHYHGSAPDSKNVIKFLKDTKFPRDKDVPKKKTLKKKKKACVTDRIREIALKLGE